MNTGTVINFPIFTGIRCLMMPYVQGYSDSVPDAYSPYKGIIESVFFRKGDIGFLTIDESPVRAGTPHRGDRAKYGRALHTEAGQKPGTVTYRWEGSTPTWGGREAVTLDPSTRILLANNLSESCAVWDVAHDPTSIDGDIGDAAGLYPYEYATLMKAGEVHDIGILTPHESLPVGQDFDRQFLRIVSSGVSGREEYFTQNPLVPWEAFMSKGLHGKHCDKYVVEEGRYCDRPAAVCQGRKYRCDEHDPFRLLDNWEPAPQWAKDAKEDDRQREGR